MLTKGKFFNICISVLLTSFFVLTLVSYGHAGGFIDGTLSQDYLNSPAIGSNVIAYIMGEYRQPPDTSSIHLFVRRCECLRRLAYTSEGVLLNYTLYLTQSEFDSLLPETLLGMFDNDGRLSIALAGETGVIAVIEKVLEYKKVGTHFAARVSIKFVAEVQAVEAEAH
ncbi:MAG: hypothetical protein ACMUIM_12255 [bacterium]